LSITGDRNEAMQQLRPIHEPMVQTFGGPNARWWRAEQVHGQAIAIVPGASEITANDGLPVVPGVDGLITTAVGALLSIYVADCGAIWLADTKTRAIGLLHSGKKGTEGNILGEALRLMNEQFGTRAEDVTAILSPCIRPPDYEVAFGDEIARQAERSGVGNFIDCGLNTASDLERFYSYRKESGKTGRMMALMIRDF
jgi:copper oxidase (laccase) domain-containing protein